MRPFISLLLIVSLPLLFAWAYEKNGEPIPVKEKTYASAISNYCNSRFDFCVNYPSSLLPVQQTSPNEDGILLKTVDEKSTVNVYGSYNVTNWCAADLFEFIVEDVTEGATQKAEIVRTAIGDGSFEALFTYKNSHYFARSFFIEDYYVMLMIKVPVDEPLMMEQLRAEVKVNYGNNG